MIIENVRRMRRELSNIERGSFTEPQIVRFHGGCNGCTIQIKYSVNACIKCKYFSANWDLPDLNNGRDATAKRVRLEVLDRAREASWTSRIISWIRK